MSRKNKPLNNREEALKEYDALIEELSKKYPNVNIKELSLDEALKKANENKKSEMMEFKAKVESTFGTDHEMKFFDIESGLYFAMLADGRHVMKDIMEKIPVEHPVDAENKKMSNRGNEKKHNLFFRIS